MHENAHKTATVFFIVDGPKLEAQAALLATSLVYHNGNKYKYIAYYPEENFDSIRRITKRVLRACNA